MNKELKKELDAFVLEKRSLPDCQRKRDLEQKIEKLKKQVKNASDFQPEIQVKYAGKVIGKLSVDANEASWIYRTNDGISTEIGFSYDEVRSWASMAGYQLRVVQ